MEEALKGLIDPDVARCALVREALTHRSAGVPHNERLEYLGDAVLGLVIAEHLYRRFSGLDEGDLSRLRSHLVRKETLAAIAREIRLGESIRLGPGELKSGGFRRDTILANALEALFGAIFVVKGLDRVRASILKLFESRLAALPPTEALKDPKSRLQEWLQSRSIALPEYALLEASGQAHAQRFHIRCAIPTLGVKVSAWAESKRGAEQACAEQALRQIQERKPPA
jgi:ribonuclease-3